jgi:hypothetical protein
MIEAYNIVLLNQFQAYYRYENEKMIMLNEKEIALNTREKAIERSRHELYTQQDMVKSVMISKDREIDELTKRLETSLAECESLT